MSAVTRTRVLAAAVLLTAAPTACMAPSTEDARSSSAPASAPAGEPRADERRLGLPARLPRREIVVPILMYHRINLPSPTAPPITRRLTVHPADFARQMSWLKRRGYRTVTQRRLFDALVHGRPLGRRPIMITFDDGYRDAFYRAAPVLRKLGMRGTAYVISGRIVNGDRHFVSWGLVRRLERRGIEIGSHTASHVDLTQLSNREALRELVRSRRALERGLSHPVQWLAYPFGRYDARIESLARRAGYVLAVTTQPGSVQSARRPLALRRLRVLDSTGVRGLAALLLAAK
jgi:peptidoglycan/xylan/chitin deacetylase (PgdA/CDA1 family)